MGADEETEMVAVGRYGGSGDAGGGSGVGGQPAGDGDALGAAWLMEWPFSLVEPEVFRAAGVARRGEAEDLAASWLGAMMDGSHLFAWAAQGPRTVVAEPDPDLPCTVFAAAREFAGCWVPTLFLMAGRRGTTCYWQWATSGARQLPLLGVEAIDGIEWVVDMLLPIVRSSIKSPAA